MSRCSTIKSYYFYILRRGGGRLDRERDSCKGKKRKDKGGKTDGKGEKGEMGMREVEARSNDLSDMLKQFGSICE